MKHFAWSFLNTFLSKGFSFIFSIILGNLILPEELGVFLTLVLILSYFVTIFSFNLGGGIVHKLNNSREIEYRNNYFSAGLLVMFGFSLIACFLFLGLQDFVLRIFNISNAANIFTMIIGLIPLNMFRDYLNRVLQADLKFKRLTVINLFSVSVQVLVTVFLVYQGKGLAGVIYGLYSGAIVGLIFFIPDIIRNYSFMLNRYTFSYSKNLIRFSSFIFVGSIAVLLDKRIDMLFVAHFLDAESLAVYNYALKFSLLFLLVGNSISKVTYPKLSKSFSNDSEGDITRVFNFSLDFSFLLLSVLSMVVLFNADFIVDTLLPSYYLKAVPFLLILFIGVIPKAVVSSVGTIFTAKGVPSVSAKINWIMLGMNIILNLILIPRFGLYGAAIATSASFFLKPFILFYLIKKKFSFINKLNRIVLNFFLFAAVLISGSLIEQIFLKELLILVYASYCIFLFLREEEKFFLLEGVNKLKIKFLSRRH
ncbi:MAG: flippase [bacterium]